jgi:UPF0755 protein
MDMSRLIEIRQKIVFWASLITGLGLILLLIWGLWVGAVLKAQYSETAYREPSPEGEVLLIESGRSAQSIAQEFERRGYFASWRLLSWYWQWTGEASLLKAGEYALKSGEPLSSLVARMTKGDVVLYPVKIGEGLQFKKLVATLQHAHFLADLALLDDPSSLAKRLGLEPVDLDGRFFPETYHVPRGASVIKVFEQAQALQKQVLAQERQGADAKAAKLTDREILSLAVLIELETPLDEEKPIVSGVFHARLERGMRMQSDPTVIYAMGEAYEGKIRTKDLRRPHWANTYVIKGLPPAPIAYASRASIRAALNPARLGYLYFVANNSGGHYFSKTLAEHNRAVQRYVIEGHKDP